MEEKLKIFFCEDDENLGMLLREYLQAKGYVTDLFSDGEAGYKGFTKGKYDLCVLDVMMPKKDGLQLCSEIKQDLRTGHIPVHHYGEIDGDAYQRGISVWCGRLYREAFQYGGPAVSYSEYLGFS